MSEFYDRQGRPMTLREWGVARGLRRVAWDTVGEAEVSTVWLGMDHSWTGPPPVIFETMIFGGSHNEWQCRYCTEAQAIAGHLAVVEALRNGAPLPGEEAA